MSSDAPLDLGPLEADFAVLHADLARIAETKLSLGNAAITALDQILEEGKSGVQGSEPAVGAQFQDALLRLLKENAASDMHGNLGFAIDQESLLLHGTPVFQGAVAAAQEKVQSILDDLTKVASGPAAPAPSERPGVKLKVDFSSLFAGLLKSATGQGPPKKG